MSHFRKFYHSDYIGSHDMPETGEVTCTIESMGMEEVHNLETHEQLHKPVLRFKGATKGLIVNVTNAKTIAAKYGNETDCWVGKKIILYGTTCEAFGDTVECVRVRIPDGEAQSPRQA